jgi:hypothetical protein
MCDTAVFKERPFLHRVKHEIVMFTGRSSFSAEIATANLGAAAVWMCLMSQTAQRRMSVTAVCA